MKQLKEMIDSIAYDDQKIKEFNRELGQRIQELRLKNEATVIQIASLCGVSESCIYGVEKGKTSISFTNLMKICCALEVSVMEVIPEFIKEDEKRKKDESK